MSLGGGGDPVVPCATTTDPVHAAICGSTAAGVNYVVAAGNERLGLRLPHVPRHPRGLPGGSHGLRDQRQRRRSRRSGRISGLQTAGERRHARLVLELRPHAGRRGTHDRRTRSVRHVDLERRRLRHDLGDQHGEPPYRGRRGPLHQRGWRERAVRGEDARAGDLPTCAARRPPSTRRLPAMASSAIRWIPRVSRSSGSSRDPSRRAARRRIPTHSRPERGSAGGGGGGTRGRARQRELRAAREGPARTVAELESGSGEGGSPTASAPARCCAEARALRASAGSR